MDICRAHRHALTLAAIVAAVLFLAAANELERAAESLSHHRELGHNSEWAQPWGARPAVWLSILTTIAGCRALRRQFLRGSPLDPIVEFDTQGNFLTRALARACSSSRTAWPSIGTTTSGSCYCQGQGWQGPPGFQVQSRGKSLVDPSVRPESPAPPRDTFNMPSAVAIAPNGDIFVADGHGGDPISRGQVRQGGKYIKEFGQARRGPGEFDIPHAAGVRFQRPPLCGRPR